MNIKIPFFRPNFTENDLLEVGAVLNTGILTYGRKVQEFEEAFKALLNVNYAIALNSATSGLHLALLALNIKKGDKVLVPVNTYPATALSVEYVGAEVVFCDIDSETLSIDFNKARNILEKDKNIKAIIPVHLAGRCLDIAALEKLKKDFEVKIIEDAAHAFFTKYKGKYVGNFSDITVFSFHPNKVLGTSEGGMICCQNKELYQKINLLKSTGINRNFNDTKLSVSPAWLYDTEITGYKYAMDSVSAAIALSQMKKSQENLLARRKIAIDYCGKLQNISEIKLLKYDFNNDEHNYHLFIIKAENRDELYQYLKDNGVETSVHYRPLHLHTKWKNNQSFLESEAYYKMALSLPIYPDLTEDELNEVVHLIKQFYLDLGNAQ